MDWNIISALLGGYAALITAYAAMISARSKHKTDAKTVEITAKTAEITGEINARSQLTAEQAEFRKAMFEELAVHRSEIKHLRENHHTLLQEHMFSRAQRMILEDEVADLKNDLFKAQVDAEEAKRELAKVQSENIFLLAKGDHYERELLDLRQEVAFLRNQLNERYPKVDKPEEVLAPLEREASDGSVPE